MNVINRKLSRTSFDDIDIDSADERDEDNEILMILLLIGVQVQTKSVQMTYQKVQVIFGIQMNVLMTV